MVGMDGAAVDRRDGITQFSRFVQAIGMHRHCHIHLFSNRETAVDHGREGSQVFVDFQAARASLDALYQSLWAAAAPACQETDVDGHIFKGLEHALQEEGWI